MAFYPLGISRRRDVPNVPEQAAGAINMRWSVADELACAYIDAPHAAIPPTLHAAALDAIHRRICVLPIRFGLACATKRKSTICSTAVAATCSIKSTAWIARAKWACGLRRRRFFPSQPSSRKQSRPRHRRRRWNI